MIRLLLNGAAGRMCRVIAEKAAGDDSCSVACGIDSTQLPASFPVYKTPAEVKEKVDVIIDFSHPSALSGILEYAVGKGIPIVVATTGFGPCEKELIAEASKTIPVFFSANMSIGVNLLLSLVKKAASVLQNDYDIEIVEKHHNQKIDAPSGTAVMIADAIAGSLDYSPSYVYDRHSVRAKRSKKEIGIHSIRGGTITGEHEVIFAGQDEIIEIKHSASSRCVFAVGALNAAKFIADKPAGLYSMADLVE